MGVWLASLGYPISGIIRAGFACPVVSSQATYRGALGLDDEVLIELYVLRVGVSSFTLGMSCWLDGILCVELIVTHVWSESIRGGIAERPRLESRPLPEWLMSALTAPSPGGSST